MATFRYAAVTRTGQREQGELEASSLEEALDLLVGRGLTPIETEPKRSSTGSISVWNREITLRRGSLEHHAQFLRELATLLSAELPIDECLRILQEENQNQVIKNLAVHILADVSGGMSLSDSFDAHAKGAPKYCSSLMRAGEARGAIAAATTEVARLLETRLELRSRIRSALMYPALLGLVSLVSLLVVLLVLVPALTPIFLEAGSEPPFVLVLAKWVTDIVTLYWPLLLLVVSGLLAALMWLGRQDAFQRWRDGMALRLPVLGPLIRKANVATLARTLGALIKNGVPLPQALQMTASAISNRVLSDDLIQARQRVMEGERLSRALARLHNVPSAAVRLITVGEETSRLDDMLLHLATIYERETTRQIERAMTILSPVMTIVIGIVVGVLVISVLKAIMGINALALR
jgi:general secretion pathway protein F